MVLALVVLALALPIATQLGAQARCAPTSADSEGPFYKPNAPERNNTGSGLVVAGTVRSATGCGALGGARIEWWSANPRGQYDDDHRATQNVDSEGRYRYETDFPSRYPGRPSHLHVRVTATGHRTLVTQLYPKSGQASLHFDFVLIGD